jgi:hypothetical protein
LSLKEKNVRNKAMTDVDPNLLKILVCPVTKGPLEYDRDAQELISRNAGLAYPIRNGIPIMLADEARVIEELKPTSGTSKSSSKPSKTKPPKS